jgi:hypothetical protein
LAVISLSPQKTLGTLIASPSFLIAWAFSVSSFRPFSFHPFWLPWFYSPFHSSWSVCNDLLLRLLNV